MKILEIKNHPDFEYYNGAIWIIGNEESSVYSETETKYLIEEYYNGFKIPVHHSSGNPELEEEIEVDGRVYVEEKFNCDYKEAYNNIEN